MRTLWLPILLAACSGGTETGNPPVVAKLSLTAHSSDPERVAVTEPQGGAVVEEAWVATGPIAFAGAEACDEAAEPQLAADGLREVAAAPRQRDFELEAGRYCRLTLPLVRAETVPEGAPADLEGAAVLLRGTLADGTPMTVASERDVVLEVRALDDAFAIEEGQRNLLLGLDVAKWLDLALEDAEREPDGSIVVRGDRNPTLVAGFEDALATGLELYRDPDGDGHVDEPGAVLLARGAPR